jgi:hypothetical protein
MIIHDFVRSENIGKLLKKARKSLSNGWLANIPIKNIGWNVRKNSVNIKPAILQYASRAFWGFVSCDGCLRYLNNSSDRFLNVTP